MVEMQQIYETEWTSVSKRKPFLSGRMITIRQAGWHRRSDSTPPVPADTLSGAGGFCSCPGNQQTETRVCAAPKPKP